MGRRRLYRLCITYTINNEDFTYSSPDCYYNSDFEEDQVIKFYDFESFLHIIRRNIKCGHFEIKRTKSWFKHTPHTKLILNTDTCDLIYKDYQDKVFSGQIKISRMPVSLDYKSELMLKQRLPANEYIHYITDRLNGEVGYFYED